MDNLGNRIVDLLEIKKMTQGQLAKKVGISNPTLSRYINNVRIPNVVICDKIAKELGVTIDFLISNENNPYKMIVGVILHNRYNLNKEQKIQLIRMIVG